MTDLNTLASMVEAATGPDRELDAAIFQALNPTFLPVDKGRRFYDPEVVSRLTAEKYITRGTYCTPVFTASLDAAMTLASGMTEARIWSIWNVALTRCSKLEDDLLKDVARYFTAAALRSRAAMGEG